MGRIPDPGGHVNQSKTMAETIRYMLASVPKSLRSKRVLEIARQSADEWNKAMNNLVRIVHDQSKPNVLVQFGRVDRSSPPNAIAQCTRYKTNGVPWWSIVLSSDVLWSDARWFEFWRGGEHSIRAALTHEFGHVFLCDPSDKEAWHSHVQGDVMNEVSLNYIIADDEAARYRKRYLDITTL